MIALKALKQKIDDHSRITLAMVATHAHAQGTEGRSIKWLRDRLNGDVAATLDERKNIWYAWDMLVKKGGWTKATLSTETGHR